MLTLALRAAGWGTLEAGSSLAQIPSVPLKYNFLFEPQSERVWETPVFVL